MRKKNKYHILPRLIRNNLHLRKHPRRLLHVFCTFNLCLVPTGENEWCFVKGATTQTCFSKKSSVILGKLTGKHLRWRLFSGFPSATLVKKILMNRPFSVNGLKHLWESASESNLRMLTILFVLLYIRCKWRVKRIKGVPLITSSSEPSTAMSNASISWHFFAIFWAS